MQSKEVDWRLPHSWSNGAPVLVEKKTQSVRVIKYSCGSKREAISKRHEIGFPVLKF